jgi:hypothetical protein
VGYSRRAGLAIGGGEALRMTISEPTTTVTDYLLAALAVGLGWRLWRRPEPGRTPRRLWAAAFGGLALAAFAGGTAHGFAEALSPGASDAIWRSTVVAVGITGAAVLLAGLATRLTPDGLRRWSLLLGAEVVVYGVWVVFVDSDFRFAVMQYGVAMLATLILYLTPAVRGRRGSAAVVAGILVSFLAAGIQQAGIAPHPAFNHNDLYHVVQMVGVVLLYRGAAAPAAGAGVQGA